MARTRKNNRKVNMYSQTRLVLRKTHDFVDALIAKILGGKTLGELSEECLDKMSILENIDSFAYAKKSHFQHLEIPAMYAKQSLKTADMKAYQDSLILTFIKQNIKPAAKILEIGGGQSRVIQLLHENYSFWNLDKLEGAGFGPKRPYDAHGHVLVQDYLGAFSPELEDHSFDFIYSISTIEHLPHDEETLTRCLADMNRLLAPGGVCLHCVDALLKPDKLEVHPLVPKVLSENRTARTNLCFDTLSKDPDLWSLPFYAYYTRYFHLTKKRLKPFGKPITINVYWEQDET
ncbi:MAG TPA: class I SAM-dependent methyltransferase [Anaerolineaceae bacterium]|nr:class I SAM-dependent methyltransferase [Anaerolineaceae bacterium]